MAGDGPEAVIASMSALAAEATSAGRVARYAVMSRAMETPKAFIPKVQAAAGRTGAPAVIDGPGASLPIGRGRNYGGNITIAPYSLYREAGPPMRGFARTRKPKFHPFTVKCERDRRHRRRPPTLPTAWRYGSTRSFRQLAHAPCKPHARRWPNHLEEYCGVASTSTLGGARPVHKRHHALPTCATAVQLLTKQGHLASDAAPPFQILGQRHCPSSLPSIAWDDRSSDPSAHH